MRASREWQRVRLYGRHWWDGSGPIDAAVRYKDQYESLDLKRAESEAALTELLGDGWEIISVTLLSGGGTVVCAFENPWTLRQESWSVFLQRLIADG